MTETHRDSTSNTYHALSRLNSCLVVHIRRRVNTLLREFAVKLSMEVVFEGNGWDLRKLDLETLLDRLENRLVVRAADEGDTQTLGSETTGTTDTVQVRIGLIRHVVVDGNVDALNIDTTSKNIRGHADTRLELLELFVSLNSRGPSALAFDEKS